MNGCWVPDDFSSWPQELRWLQWRWFCFAKLPSQLKLPSLVVLDLRHSYKLTHLWDVDDHIQLPLLQTLVLEWCRGLEELAENVGQSLPKLKRLMMAGCNSLRRLPESVGHLTDLEHLDLSWCKVLVTLPDGMVGLVNLRTLDLYCCKELQRLLEELVKLTNLETLDLRDCNSLWTLPASIGGLKLVKTFYMEGTEVKDLPPEFGLLTSLFMGELRSVPETFQGLQALTSLSLRKASADMSVLGALTALKDLDLLKHATITALPKSFGNLKWLVRLNMCNCQELLTVEALPEGLEQLQLSHCDKLTEIPSLAGMRSFVHLDLHYCASLRHVPGLACLTMLEHINVSGSTSINGRGIRLRGRELCASVM